ncbi:T9SS type A sorting domain-containing protein [Bizionia gelidisalsuginis]|uniref:T9SS type A sorting domain-containing protein n=1 Tax=Bizionia gelidisalsuginis TaxID=291188 RepID=A0ABY3MBL6_9FLAO|nr:T9SS type A sorting domain-containing protein [Bizionia gelidisalsuginis]TYC14208.1 T9SS type A sorting domain-containing protein [Bizionia gelidisalsuginis]
MSKLYMSLMLILTLSFGAEAQVYPTTSWSDNTDVTWYDATQNQFTISTEQALAGLSMLVEQGTTFDGKTLNITADIDLDAHLWTPIGTGVDFPFSGTVDGGNFTISNLWINLPNDDFVGLFGQTTGASFLNIIIENSNILAEDTAGTLVRNLSLSSNMDNCHARNISITASSYNIGGLVGGVLSDSHMTKCSITGDVIGVNQVGGLAGTAWNNTTISECYSEGTVSGGFLIGGLVGYCTFAFTPNTQNSINNSYSRSIVSANSGRAGGIYGGSDDTLILNNSYSTGTVTSPEYAGATIGAYGTGSITIGNTYFDLDSSQMTNGVGGYLGNTASPDISGRTTPNMKNSAIVDLLNAGSSNNPWTRDATINDGYPILESLLSVDQNTVTVSETVVYPTVFTDRITVSSTAQLKSFSMYSITGALVLEGDLSQNNTIQPQTLSAGVYILNITTDKGMITKKVIKQ